jgi:hypothetical protein
MTVIPTRRPAVEVHSLVSSVHEAIVSTVFPDYAGQPGFERALGECVRENVQAIVDILAGEVEVDDVRPDRALAFAELVTCLDVPEGALERAYWVGVERFWQEWVSSSQALGMPDDSLGEITTTVFSYARRVLELVAARRGTTGVRDGAEQRRRELVEDLLGGSVERPRQELENALGYRLRGTHLALLIEGERAAAQRGVAALRERTGAWGSITMQHGGDRCAAWLGYPRPVDTAVMDGLRDAISGFARRVGPVAVGEPGAEIDGLRRSHRQACRAAEVRDKLAEQAECLWYRDVRLESLLLDDPPAARLFVDEELGDLAEDTARAARIRETLRVSLTAGSQARAAAELGVHENTVRLRIRSATELLGDVLAERRTELLVALRLRRALGGPAQPPRAQPDPDMA